MPRRGNLGDGKNVPNRTERQSRWTSNLVPVHAEGSPIFSEKSSPDEREEIRRLAAQLDGLYALMCAEQGLSRERSFEIHRFHMRFHMRVAECTGCDELCQAVERNQVLVFNWLYDTALGNEQPPPGWHTQLANALVSGDPEAADAAMRSHTRFRMDEVRQRLEPYFSMTHPRLAAYPNRPRQPRVAPASVVPDP